MVTQLVGSIKVEATAKAVNYSSFLRHQQRHKHNDVVRIDNVVDIAVVMAQCLVLSDWLWHQDGDGRVMAIGKMKGRGQ